MALDIASQARPGSLGGAVLAVGNLGRIAAVPWKNEGGQTRELCVEPADADFSNFIWRASVADVGRDGAFSTFDGIARTIVLLEGGGFTMHSGGAEIHDLRECFAPYAFAGETHISVRLHGAPTLDFNLMIRRDLAEGEVLMLNEQNSRRLPAGAALLYVAQGVAALADAAGQQQALRVGDFVRLREGTVLPELLCAAGAVVLAVCIRRKA
ncbi:MAG: Protein Ves [Herbaspirillum frisingense]|uniref:Protein Ves n=1 Tax=Herbaspirillum frisingense TaxID=92645 RepID=A0A7V8FV98_9BURK|nr:MAG: Protein Ves [Herbaspirillum frisingense]